MLPHSDFCFDKNGVYESQWIASQKKADYIKFPFRYNEPVSAANTFITDDSRYVIYQNQAYNPWTDQLYKHLTPEQIRMAKANQLSLDDPTGAKTTEFDKYYDNLLYEANNIVYWNGQITIADAATFRSIRGMFYKDIKNVYIYSPAQGLSVVQGIDGKSIAVFNHHFLKDDQYLYHNRYRLIKSKSLEILGIFTGYRKGCGLDKTPTSNYYLFKNTDGYWLVCLADTSPVVRHLGSTLPNQDIWIPKLKEPFQH